MSIWHPIATAPKDGTTLIGYVPNSALSEIVFIRWDTVGNEDWMHDFGNGAACMDVWPTHWMPLPGPPGRAA